MLLVGRHASPYVRRVAVCMTELGLPFEREIVSPLQAPERVETFNPMGRVPVLILDGSRLTLADIAVAIGWRTLQSMAPAAPALDRFPRLAAHAGRCESLASFVACQPESGLLNTQHHAWRNH